MVMMEPIDLDRIRKATKRIYIKGRLRPSLAARAIGAIQANPAGAMRTEYLGIKNYEAFGDQDHDGPYNTGPRHGSIVNEIGRNDIGNERNQTTPLGADEIYAIECARDFPGTEERRNEHPWPRIIHRNLFDTIRAMDTAQKEYVSLRVAIDAARVDSHELVTS